MKKADKYPAIDPRLPNLYRRVIDAAAQMRSARHAENVAHWAVRKAQRIASLPASKNGADDLSPTLGNSPKTAATS